MNDRDPSCGCPLTRAAREADARAAAVRAAGIPEGAPVTVVRPRSREAFVRLATLEPIPAPTVGSRIAPCLTVTYDGFWLRSTPTFDRVGHHYPAETPIEASEQTEFRRGPWRLYGIRVQNFANDGPALLTGFAALTTRDLLNGGCAWAGPNVALLWTYRKTPDEDKAP